jgi:hypothetical protein
MAHKSFVFLVMGVMIFFFCSISSADVPHMINYQGKLTTPQGALVNDTVSMTFSIYPDTFGTVTNWRETQAQVVVKDGIFDVLLGSVFPILDTVFIDGGTKYLGVKVGSDPEMRPLKPIVSVPYAYRAWTAESCETNYWYEMDSVLYTNKYWGIARGGAGNVLYGNKAHTMVNLGVNSTTGTNGQNYEYCTVGGGWSNAARALYATVGGGDENTASGTWATISGGVSNYATNYYATVVGGAFNTASGGGATVAGGDSNTASGNNATVAGGFGNTVSGSSGIIGGGAVNFVAGDYSAILGGYADTITSTADYSYLFGIKGKLTDDSTFMVALPYSRFDGDVTLNKNDGELVLHTPGHNDPGRYRIKFDNNNLAPFIGDDTEDQYFDFYTEWSANRTYDAHLKVHGSATGDWGKYIELTHDGVDGIIRTDSGDIALLPAGNVGIGTASPQGALDVNSTTGALIVPRMTTTQRNALTAVNGMIIYNTTTNQFNFYENGAWVIK